MTSGVAPVRSAITSAYASLGSHPVAPGVTRDWGTATASAGKQTVNVVEVDPHASGVALRTSLASNRVNARERTTSQALAYSREGRRVVATINGSTFGSWPTGHVAARGLNVRNGELLTAGRVWAGLGPILSFAIDGAGQPMIGMPTLDIEVAMPGGAVGRLLRVNQGRLADEGVLFTPRFDIRTRTDTNGDEYVIDGLNLPLRPSGTYSGTVAQVRRGQGNTPIAAGHVVISVTGAAAEPFRQLAVGDPLTISLTIEPGWEGIVQAVGGRELLVQDGETHIVPLRPSTATATHPRSAVGITEEGRVLLVTVDGRSADSGGLTLHEMAELMLEQGAVSALNLDGGGSTTLAVRRPGDIEASIVNTPSDGSERTVATTLQVVSTVPTGELDTLLLSPRQTELYQGQQVQYVVKGHDANHNGIAIAPASLSWTVSSGAATANSSAQLTALEPGEHTVTARTQKVEDTVALVVHPDVTPPSISAPRLQLRGGLQLSRTKAKLAIGWTADDAHSGLARIELQRRVNGGAWQSVSLPGPSARTAFGEVQFGRTVQYRARATDAAGNRSPWTPGQTLRVTLYDERNPAITRGADWLQRSSTATIGGGFARSLAPGAMLSLSFEGSQVAWVSVRGPRHGQTHVHLSGSQVATVNAWHSSGLYRRVLYVSPLADTSAGVPSQTISLQNAGTAARPRTDLDAFIVLGPAD
ncbi:MAG TPA: phosphodiester glycosidase family protein [Candidatus Limnocylindria bacterium]|nr:phosphodiester glycosidase family protein [Candidatus Limnocylindria bacterium]